MALAADSKSLYIPISTIYGKPNADGTYTLNALDVKNLNDNLYAIAKKVQGGLTTSDLTSAAVDELHAGTVISNTVITNNLYATYGDVAELTVDRLITVDKIERYKNGDTSDINYIKAQNEYIQFITGTTNGTTTQHKNRSGELLYWSDVMATSMGTAVTEYPVTIYNYTEMVKTKIAFKEISLPDDGSTVMPVFTLGAGTGIGDNAKGFIYKGLDGLYIDYQSTSGELRRIMLGDEGITITPYDLESIDIFNNGFSAQYNGTPVAMTWTLDANGRITSLITTDNVTIPVTWHTEDM